MRIVLLHAFPLDHRMWDAQVTVLREAGHDVTAIDLPGFGGSQVLAGESSLASVADHIVEQHLQSPAVVAGLSLGGYVLMQLLRDHASLVQGAMFLDTKASADAPAAIENRLRIATMADEDPSNLGRFLVTAMLPTLIAEHSAVRDQVERWLMESPAAAVAWYQRAMAARPDAHDVLAAYHGPSLVLWGAKDQLSPEAEQRTMIEALRTPRVVEVEDSGHLSAVEQPAPVTQALVDTLEAWSD